MNESATLYRYGKRMRAGAFWCLLVALCCGYLLTSPDAQSRSDGSINGRTSTTSAGCNCHSASTSASTTLAITDGALTVSPGSATTYTLTVGNGAKVSAGVNIGVKTSSTGRTAAGTLLPATGSGLKALGGELVHSSPKGISGGRASFAFTWVAPATPGIYYIQAVGNAVNGNGSDDNGDQWNWLTPVAVTVAGLEVTAPNTTLTWCAGSTQNITWTAAGVANVKIEVSADGDNYTTLIASTPAAAGSWAWNIPASQTPGTQYRVRVSDVESALRSDISNAPFSIQSAPALIAQPAAQTVCAGQAVQLAVEATGNPISYQWRKNGTNIAGATSATYAIGSSSAGDGGRYDVVVSNACSTLTSSSVTVTVNTPPAISLHPLSRTVCIAQPVTFSVGATGSQLTYQWRKNGTAIAGKTDATLTLDAVSSADAGEYDVVVSGICSAPVTSNPATLSIGEPPEITSQPVAVTTCQGVAATFSVSATGSQLLYQWRKNGTPIPGATDRTYTIAAPGIADAGSYSVVISGLCSASMTSTAATLTINPLPAVLTPPAHHAALQGSAVMLTVVAGEGALQRQWRKDGVDIIGATSDTLRLAAVQPGDAGEYTVQVRNACGSVVSAAGRLTVHAPGAGALVSFSPTQIAMGTVSVGKDNDVVFTNLIMNSGDSILQVTGVTIAGAQASEFSLVEGGGAFELAPLASRTVTLRFAPAEAGLRTATLEIASNAKNTQTATLVGFGVRSGVTSLVPSVDFGSVDIGAARDTFVAICNNSGADVQIASIAIEGGAFRIRSETPAVPFLLNTDSCFLVILEFLPTAAGSATATLSVGLAGDPSAVSVPLAGIGRTIASVPVAAARTLAAVTIVPNPVSEDAVITLTAAHPARIGMQVVDLHGRTIRTLVSDELIVGTRTVVWDGRSSNGLQCPAGTYHIVVRSGKEVMTTPVVLVR